MDGEADSRKPLQTGALENGFEYLTDNPDNSNPVTRTTKPAIHLNTMGCGFSDCFFRTLDWPHSTLDFSEKFDKSGVLKVVSRLFRKLVCRLWVE